ncbi:MAG TPA: DNA repair protein RecO [Bryobacteraceae bacterium]|nr:DNA repair protein RecO [Bryobacteraceae bacterium]
MSEAFILRTYPFQEGDLVVSFFTRDLGRLRGVAKRARRLKSAFGSSLERLSQVQVSYLQKETLELVRIDGCDLVQSQFGLSSDFDAGVVLDYIAEVSEHLLPPAEPNERFFRLLAAVLVDLRSSGASGVWRAATYFSYWAVRLSGFLPEHRLSESSRTLAAEIASSPISSLAVRSWPKTAGSDLRKALVREIEDHIERRLMTAPVLEAL